MKLTEKQAQYLAGLVMKDIRQRQIEADYYTQQETQWKRELAKRLMNLRE